MVQGDKKFNLNMMFKPKFAVIFVLVVTMHALWDSPIKGMFPVGQIILMTSSWVLVFIMIRKGLKEIAERKWELHYEHS
jgi:hypothetical protein